MSDNTVDKAYHVLSDEIEIHSIFENPLEIDGTVNVPPEDASKTKELLEDNGFTVVKMEDLRETADTPGDAPGEPGDLFTRINFQKGEELRVPEDLPEELSEE